MEVFDYNDHSMMRSKGTAREYESHSDSNKLAIIHEGTERHTLNKRERDATNERSHKTENKKNFISTLDVSLLSGTSQESNGSNMEEDLKYLNIKPLDTFQPTKKQSKTNIC